jgi:hypothetical protein
MVLAGTPHQKLLFYCTAVPREPGSSYELILCSSRSAKELTPYLGHMSCGYVATYPLGDSVTHYQTSSP